MNKHVFIILLYPYFMLGNITRNNDFSSKVYVGENDIVISEIMFDPTPEVNLPNAEYVELYNRSGNDILMSGWKFTVGSKTYSIPVYTIKSGGYVLLTKDETLFSGIDIIEINITSLTNSGTVLSLESDNGDVIDEVSYSTSLFTNDNKKSGGWSLEIINPYNDCLIEGNWSGSGSDDGGTPGYENSILDNNYFPEIKNVISSITVNDDVSTVSVEFEYYIDESTVLFETDYTNNYSVDSENKADGSSIVTITLDSGLAGDVYFFLFDDLKNCDGSEVLSDTIWISSFEKMEAGDVIVNEIMFNPFDDSSEFIELYNNSDKFISLRGVYVCNFTMEEEISVSDNLKKISSDNILFEPRSYIVVTKNRESVKEFYSSGFDNDFIEISSLPKLNNDDGNIAVLSPSFEFVDKMTYSSEMHIGLIKDDKQKGVSLERIVSSNPSLDFNNWTSASQGSKGATPGLKNSVTPSSFAIEDMFEVYPEVFTPNNDGLNDVVELKYTNEIVGSIATVKIFNSQGIFIKDIANNYLLGSTGSFIWDGNNSAGAVCEKGIYIYWIEIFDLEGNVKSYKKILVLG